MLSNDKANKPTLLEKLSKKSAPTRSLDDRLIDAAFMKLRQRVKTAKAFIAELHRAGKELPHTHAW